MAITEEFVEVKRRGKVVKLNVSEMSVNSKILVTLKCDICGNIGEPEPYRNIVRRRQTHQGVDMCCDCRRAPIPPFERSLQYLSPDVAKEWHPKLNKRTPSQVYNQANVKAWWFCQKCESSWDSLISVRTRKQQSHGCPYCSGRRVNDTNSLQTKRPELAKEWHTTKNQGLTPNDITLRSSKRVWWICPTCASDYKTPVYYRTDIRGTGCPYCSGRKVNETNCLATTHPHLITEWDFLNNIDTPYNTTQGSHKIVSWLCEEGHSYTMKIKERVQGARCTECFGHTVTKHNNLQVRFPKVAKEWHPTKNGELTPLDIMPGVSIIVWWRCSVDPTHEWEARVGHRTTSESGCPFCKISKGEKRVATFLNSKNIQYEPQYVFDNLKGVGGGVLKFDFAVLDDKHSVKFLIEYDGEQHFKAHEFFGGVDAFKLRIQNDCQKDKYCLDNNIPLFRIPYWELNNVEKILKSVLASNNIDKWLVKQVNHNQQYIKSNIIQYIG